MALVIALLAVAAIVIIVVKVFRGRNGEMEKGNGVELVDVDVEMGDEMRDETVDETGVGDVERCGRWGRGLIGWRKDEEDGEEDSDGHHIIQRHLDRWD